MNNKEIAAIFRDLALISEFLGDNPFKVNAYRNAYKLIDSLEIPVSEVLSKGEKVRGIGEIIKKKIEEILATGRLKKHIELTESIPQTLLPILRESDISPRIIRKLYDNFNVTNWEELGEIYFSGKLSQFGIGASSIKKIEQALRRKGLI